MSETQDTSAVAAVPPSPTELAVPMPKTPVAAAIHQITIANRAKCEDDITLDKCLTLDRQLQQSEKRIADDHKAKTEGLTAAKRAIDAEKREIAQGLASARRHVQGLILSYRQGLREAAEEEAARARQEAEDKALQTAEELEAQGRSEEASQVLEEGSDLADGIGTTQQVGPVRGTLATASFTTVVQFEVTDSGQVPREFCSPDEKLIREAVRRKENPVTEIPGVRIWTEEKMVNRG